MFSRICTENTKVLGQFDPFLTPGCGPERWARLRNIPFFSISQQNCNNLTSSHQKMSPLPFPEWSWSIEAKEIIFVFLAQLGPLGISHFLVTKPRIYLLRNLFFLKEDTYSLQKIYMCYGPSWAHSSRTNFRMLYFWGVCEGGTLPEKYAKY